MLVEKPRPVQVLTCFSRGKTGQRYNIGDKLSGTLGSQAKDKTDKPWQCDELRFFHRSLLMSEMLKVYSCPQRN